jgi:AcrR family transcriptional regulator
MTASNIAGSVSRMVTPAPVWTRPDPGARRPRFSREQIAAAALAIADAGGFEAVTMRRIAAALGAGTMSLYRYIETKDDLLALIDDAILGEALVAGSLPADWRDALALVARRTREAYLRHPWAVPALHGRHVPGRSAGPNGLRHLEQCLAAVAGAPLSQRARLGLLGIVDDYVYGHLLRAALVAAGAARRSGPADSAAALRFIQARLDAGDLPQLAALGADPARLAAGDPGELDARFELGLRLIIDGAAAGLPAPR